MGQCLSCLGRYSSLNRENDFEGNDRTPLLQDQRGEGALASLTEQLRDAKLLAVLNATNDRLLDHDDQEGNNGEDGEGIKVVDQQGLIQEIQNQKDQLDPILLQSALQIK